MNDYALLQQKRSDEDEKLIDTGSFNHSAVQANLAFLFKRLGIYRVSTELSLDVSEADLTGLASKDEVKPDLCLYPKRSLSRPFDILRMSEMPLLVVEVLSPRQGSEYKRGTASDGCAPFILYGSTGQPMMGWPNFSASV